MIKLIGVDEPFSSQIRSKGTSGKLFGERAIGIVDLQRCGLCTMRTALCTDQFTELRNIHRCVTGAVETREPAALMHKTDEATQHFRIGKDLPIAAVHK